jgi:hypothetical protein
MHIHIQQPQVNKRLTINNQCKGGRKKSKKHTKKKQQKNMYMYINAVITDSKY